MSKKSLILITIFISNALALQNFNTTKWEEIEKQLTKYHDSLLNEEIVTDLKECHNYNSTKDYQVGVICSNYFDLVLQISKTKSNITFTKEIIKYELEKSENYKINTSVFCNKWKNSIPDNNLFNDIETCILSCLSLKQSKKTLKPICKIIDFMLLSLTNKTTIINDDIPIDRKIIQKTQVSNISQKTLDNSTTNNQDQKHLQDSKKEALSNDNSLKIERKINTQQGLNTQKIYTNEMNKLLTGTMDKTSTKLDLLINKSISNPQFNTPSKTALNFQLPVVPTKNSEIKASINSEIKASINDKTNKINEDPKFDMNGMDIDDNDLEEDKLINGQDGNYYGQDGDDDKIKSPLPPKLPDIKQTDKNDDIKLQQQKQESTFNKFNEIRNEFDNNEHKVILNDPFYEKSGSNFFTYLLISMFGCIILYVLYHNKSKILALLLEGRRGQKGRGGRRKHTAAYRKLDSNLEEAISSPSSARSSQIIY